MPMSAEDGAECAVLEPARVKLLKRRVRKRIIVRRPIASDVGGPVWVTGKGKIEAGGNLMAQTPVSAVDVSRPYGGAHALLPKKRRTRQQKNTLVRVLGLPVLLHTEGVQKREDVCKFGAIAD